MGTSRVPEHTLQLSMAWKHAQISPYMVITLYSHLYSRLRFMPSTNGYTQN